MIRLTAMSAGILVMLVRTDAFAASPPNEGFAKPMQAWMSEDRTVELRHPLSIVPSAVGFQSYFQKPGWRFVWDGGDVGPGRLAVSFVVEAIPGKAVAKTVTESLQVGLSRDPEVVRSCLTYGLNGENGRRLADRTISGRVFVVYVNGDAGMSQSVSVTDLRTVANGTCYAIGRATYSDVASDGNVRATTSQQQADDQLDAIVETIRIKDAASGHPSESLPPPMKRQINEKSSIVFPRGDRW